jgi:hypothetical protein
MGIAAEPESKAWDALTGSLGLAGTLIGERRNSPAGVPPLAGIGEAIGAGKHPHALLLRLDEPAPGIAFLNAHTMGGQVYLAISFYLYGDQAAAAVARDEQLWRAWMNERFPAVGDASNID